MYKTTIILLSYLFAVVLTSSIGKNEDENLEVFRDDIAQVGGAIENFTFDILESILKKIDGKKPENSIETSKQNDDKSSEITTEKEKPQEQLENTTQYLYTSTESLSTRKKRSLVDQDVEELCRKHTKCEINPNQVEDLRLEVVKLQEIVNLIKNQHNFIHLLNETTKIGVSNRENIENNATSSEELEFIHENLREAIKSLNETRQMLEIQKEKDRILEIDLKHQKQEIRELKNIVRKILAGNSTEILDANTVLGAPPANATSNMRANSDFTEIRKFLKKLPKEDDDVEDSREIQSKILEIEKKLQKKKKQDSLSKQLKALERQLNYEEESDSILIKQLQKALKLEGKNDDIDDLDDLKDAIDRLRPKEDNSVQFQTILRKLIRNQQRPSNTLDFRKPAQVPVQPPTPYICPGQYNRNIQYSRPVETNPSFFPDAPANYYSEGNPNGASPEKPINYQPEIGDNQQKYQEDLRSEINGLQTAIDGLNRPEYIQKPEDKAVIDDLGRQINDLRAIVNNLNGNYDSRRAKRSLNDNQLDDADHIVDKMTNFMGNMLDVKEKNSQTQTVTQIQNKIDKLKNQLGQENSQEKVRASPGNYYGDDDFYYQPKSVKSSVKDDLFVQIVSKIMDKIIASIPVVIKKLFSIGFDDLTQVDYQDYEIQSILKNLGVFGYLPIIFLKIIRGISYFLNVLKKNKFFKNFLLPITILGIVFGSIFFLMWWLQPDAEEYKNIDYSNNYNDYNYRNVPRDPKMLDYYGKSYSNK